MAAFFLAFLVLPAAFAGQDKVMLKRQGVVGGSSRYEGTSSIKLNVGGQDLKIQIAIKSKMTVEEVTDEGYLKLKSEVLDMKVTFNGEEMPGDEDASTESSMTIRPDGTLVEYESAEEDDTGMSQRIMQATQIIFPNREVGAGDKWDHQFAGDDDKGFPKAKASFTLVGFEDVNGTKAAKIQIKYEELTDDALKGSGTVWIDVESGESIKTDQKLVGSIDLDGMAADGEIVSTDKRSGGSLMVADEESMGDDEGTDEGDEDGDEKDETIDAKVKGYEKVDGLFPIYKKMDDGDLKLFMEIPRSSLNSYYMLQTTASTGDSATVVAGDPISDVIFQFREMPNGRIYMVVPNYGFRADEHAPILRALKRSFSDSFIESFEVEAKQEDRDSVLIDISHLFLGNIGSVYEVLMGGGGDMMSLFGGGGSYSPDRDKSYIESLKNFPENLSVRSIYAFDGGGGGGGGMSDMMGGPTLTGDARSLVVAISYNLFKLPTDNGFVPREFDDRVGYFTVDFDDMTDMTTRTAREMFINRWNLQKKDPDAAVSEPVEQIVFWLDNAIPDEYRTAVAEGILAWNKAFEKAGYRNAIRVEQMPADADFDHADMRYNVIRWVASPGSAYAVALFRTNPLTGEILNASITVDANLVRFGADEKGTLVSPDSFFKRPTKEEVAAKMHKHGRATDCDFGHGLEMQKNLAGIALEMVGGLGAPMDKEKYIQDFLRHVVAHEMGHILGLRHNFVGSTQLSLEEMKNPAKVAKYGTSASLMDYVPFNPSAIKQKDMPYYSATLGQYDFWAITYGYADIEGDQKEGLKAIARQGAGQGLAWLGDEFADFNDPYVSRFDIGKEPLDYWQRMLQLSRYLIFDLDKHYPKEGQSYYDFTYNFNQLFNTYSSAAARLTQYIGSYRKFRDHAGDPGARLPMEPVAPENQRRALDLLKTYVFSERAFDFPKSYYNKFTGNPKAGILEGMMDGMDDYAMYDQFAAVQGSALSAVMNTGVLNRLWNFEWKAEKGAKVLSTRQFMTEIKDEVWSELKNGHSVSALRRQLQREHINMLIQAGLPDYGASSEVSAMAWDQLRNLRTSLQAASKRNSDAATKLHIGESLMRVNRALNAIETIGSSGGGGGMPSLADLLGGRAATGK